MHNVYVCISSNKCAMIELEYIFNFRWKHRRFRNWFGYTQSTKYDWRNQVDVPRNTLQCLIGLTTVFNDKLLLQYIITFRWVLYNVERCEKKMQWTNGIPMTKREYFQFCLDECTLHSHFLMSVVRIEYIITYERESIITTSKY